MVILVLVSFLLVMCTVCCCSVVTPSSDSIVDSNDIPVPLQGTVVSSGVGVWEVVGGTDGVSVGGKEGVEDTLDVGASVGFGVTSTAAVVVILVSSSRFVGIGLVVEIVSVSRGVVSTAGGEGVFVTITKTSRPASLLVDVTCVVCFASVARPVVVINGVSGSVLIPEVGVVAGRDLSADVVWNWELGRALSTVVVDSSCNGSRVGVGVVISSSSLKFAVVVGSSSLKSAVVVGS